MQCGPTALLILLPLSLIRDMSGFRHLSVVSIFALLYTGIILFVELPSYSQYASEHRDQFRIEYAWFDWNFFTGASITFFAYTCHT
jgi:amino acid permease